MVSLAVINQIKRERAFWVAVSFYLLLAFWRGKNSRGRNERAHNQPTRKPKDGGQPHPPTDAATARRRRRGRSQAAERKQENRGTAAPIAGRDDPAPTTHTKPANPTRGADNRKRPQRGGTRRAGNPPRQQSQGRATQPTQQGQRGRGAEPPSPKPATPTGRRGPRDETTPQEATRKHPGRGRGSGFLFLFLILILGNCSYSLFWGFSFVFGFVPGFFWILICLFPV